MTVWFVYILYSRSLDRYYIGVTENVEVRFTKHLAKHRGYTGSATDWELKYVETFPAKRAALIREKQLKRWKNRKRIEELISRSA